MQASIRINARAQNHNRVVHKNIGIHICLQVINYMGTEASIVKKKKMEQESASSRS
jgi:hypothetical protein